MASTSRMEILRDISPDNEIYPTALTFVKPVIPVWRIFSGVDKKDYFHRLEEGTPIIFGVLEDFEVQFVMDFCRRVRILIR